MTTSTHILVVDDHREIRDSLSKFLAQHGFRTSSAEDAATARHLLKDSKVDLVVLDIMMPGEDGLSLCRHLRETAGTPVILLTAMADDTDRIIGLEVGADDYVTKPFNPRELVARIKAVLSRVNSLPPDTDELDEEKIAFDRWILDVRRRELVDEDGVTVPLSTGEFNLLSALVARPDRVLSREQLLDITQSRAADVFDRSIDNQISRLRKKLEKNPRQPEIIKTVWGGGYRFTASIGKPASNSGGPTGET